MISLFSPSQNYMKPSRIPLTIYFHDCDMMFTPLVKVINLHVSLTYFSMNIPEYTVWYTFYFITGSIQASLVFIHEEFYQ